MPQFWTDYAAEEVRASERAMREGVNEREDEKALGDWLSLRYRARRVGGSGQGNSSVQRPSSDPICIHLIFKIERVCTLTGRQVLYLVCKLQKQWGVHEEVNGCESHWRLVPEVCCIYTRTHAQFHITHTHTLARLIAFPTHIHPHTLRRPLTYSLKNVLTLKRLSTHTLPQKFTPKHKIILTWRPVPQVCCVYTRTHAQIHITQLRTLANAQTYLLTQVFLDTHTYTHT